MFGCSRIWFEDSPCVCVCVWKSAKRITHLLSIEHTFVRWWFSFRARKIFEFTFVVFFSFFYTPVCFIILYRPRCYFIFIYFFSSELINPSTIYCAECRRRFLRGDRGEWTQRTSQIGTRERIFVSYDLMLFGRTGRRNKSCEPSFLNILIHRPL